MLHKKLYKIFLFISTAYLLTSCASVGGRGWPVESYWDVCDLPRMEPMEPMCLSSAQYDGGFKWRDQFQACRQSVNNYVDALHSWEICSIEFVNNRLLDYARRANDTLDCLESSLPEEYSIQPSILNCSPVDANIDLLQVLNNFKVNPMCIAKKEFFPRSKGFDLKRCRDEVENYIEFMEDNIRRAQIDISFESQRKAIDANRIFNCLASRGRNCS